ncbi:hypothetical protein [Halorubrum sp. DM2]|uniref:hypothetical protein n=1 Tax=Halorubrum sp. DM2 TaxID=2527867 RepID=UPI0024B64471|nr:hypothetical protein [Halorubrum sp. DM2]
MIGPSEFDEESYLGTLSKGDRKRFDKLYREKWHKIDPSRAKTLFRRDYRDKHQEEQKLFSAVVDGFPPDESTTSTESGYETTLVNPLYECLEQTADVLLAKPTYHDVHLCFVCCEIGGENRIEWVERVNRIKQIFDQEEHRRELMEQIECDDLDLGSIQYATVSRPQDLVEIDFDLLEATLDVDNYVILEHVEEERLLTPKKGGIASELLRTEFEDGLDYSRADVTEIKYRLNEHPIIPLKQTLLEVIVSGIQDGTDQHPREFEREDFHEKYDASLDLGVRTEGREEVIGDNVDELLDEAKTTDLVFQNSEEINTEREFRFRTSNAVPEDIKDTVEQKYTQFYAKRQRGQLAFERAERDFEEEDSDLGDFE